MTGSAAILAGAALPRQARANVPVPYSWQQSPPTTSREAFISWMTANRGEDPKILALRWDRYLFLKANHDFVNDRNGRLVASFPVEDSDQIMLVTDGGKLIRCPIDDVRIAGRNTQGVRIFKTEESEKVVSVERVPEDGNGTAGNGDGAAENGEAGGEPGA